MYDIVKTLRANSVAHALQLLEENPGAIITAGGTDVIISLKHRKLKQATLVSILDLEELKGVHMTDEGDLLIGAGTCFAALEENPLLINCTPMLASACRQVGSPQIRAVATIGGNICNGAVSADSVPSLLALDAVLELFGPKGPEQTPLLGFHTGPGKTNLGSNRILTAIRIPHAAYAGCGGCYLKFGQRRAMEISTLGCAVNVRMNTKGERVEKIAIAYGVAGPIPIRCTGLEARLQSMVPGEIFDKTFRKYVLEELYPRDSWRASKELRVQLIKELGCRAAWQAIVQAGGTAFD